MVNNVGVNDTSWVGVVYGMPRAGSSRAGQNRIAGRTWPAGRVLHVVDLEEQAKKKYDHEYYRVSYNMFTRNVIRYGMQFISTGLFAYIVILVN